MPVERLVLNHNTRRARSVVRVTFGPGLEFGPAELAAMQQHDRITLSRFEIAGGQAIDKDRFAVGLDHVVSHAARANVSS